MNVALYGGTFDPVHKGHLAVARAAARRFKLGRIYFVPADIQPLKKGQPTTPYYHRHAMLSLALAGEKTFIPSLLEAPEIMQAEGLRASYSIDTVLRLKRRLKKSDRLFFLIGIDAFLSIQKWRSAAELLRECEFIVASRPGLSLANVADALPDEMRPSEEVTRVFRKHHAEGDIVHGGAVIHLLSGINEPESSTEIRAAAAAGKSVARWVPEPVVEYIKKTQIYQSQPEPGVPDINPSGKPAPDTAQKKLHLIHRRS